MDLLASGRSAPFRCLTEHFQDSRPLHLSIVISPSSCQTVHATRSSPCPVSHRLDLPLEQLHFLTIEGLTHQRCDGLLVQNRKLVFDPALLSHVDLPFDMLAQKNLVLMRVCSWDSSSRLGKYTRAEPKIHRSFARCARMI